MAKIKLIIQLKYFLPGPEDRLDGILERGLIFFNIKLFYEEYLGLVV